MFFICKWKWTLLILIYALSMLFWPLFDHTLSEIWGCKFICPLCGIMYHLRTIVLHYYCCLCIVALCRSYCKKPTYLVSYIFLDVYSSLKTLSTYHNLCTFRFVFAVRGYAFIMIYCIVLCMLFYFIIILVLIFSLLVIFNNLGLLFVLYLFYILFSRRWC